MAEFKVVRYRIRSGEGQPKPAAPFSAVFLSDLHNDIYGHCHASLLAAIREEQPVAVFVAGDMLTSTRPPQTANAVSLMNELTKKYPVYYANGNHESRLKERLSVYGEAYETYSQAIKSLGVRLLENGSEAVELGGLPLRIWGLELPLSYYKRWRYPVPTGEEIAQLLGSPAEGAYNLLLAHHPLFFDAYAAWGADLTLSGHLHGGLVRIPGLGGLVSPQLRLFPRYDRGLFERDGKKLVVSAGLGSHTLSFRINNPPELVVLEFR